jgi:hypothetical protein
MHRETNLQVENEETIEALSARTHEALLDGIQQRFFFARSVCMRIVERRAFTHPFIHRLGLTRLSRAARVRYTRLSLTG